MKVLVFLSLLAVCEFIKEVGWIVFAGLSIYILVDFIYFAFSYNTDFHFLRAFLLLGGLLLILLIAYKLPELLKIKET